MRWLRRSILAAALAAVTLCAAAVRFEPAVMAYVCPRCYGLEAIGDRLYIEKGAGAFDRRRLIASVAVGRAQAAAFYGGFSHRPVILACRTRLCDRRLGGRGAAGRTYGAAFISLSPRGWRASTIAHELSHVHVHHMVGLVAALTGTMPAWFDEGLAVVVSGDRRFLNHKRSGRLACKVEPRAGLPINFRAWSRASRDRKRPIYAEAGCRVLRWLAANGGRAKLTVLLPLIGKGRIPL